MKLNLMVKVLTSLVFGVVFSSKNADMVDNEHYGYLKKLENNLAITHHTTRPLHFQNILIHVLFPVWL